MITRIFGKHQENTLVQLLDVDERAVYTSLMGDGHWGYTMPIGGVAAYRNQVSVAGVGFDIACGNAAIRTNLTVDGLLGMSREEMDSNPYKVQQSPILQELADQIFSEITFGVGGWNQAPDAPVEDPLFIRHEWNIIPNIGGYRDELRELARKQLGSIGSGNHYVDVFADQLGRIWVGVHFGSRKFGHTIASNFFAIAQGGTWGDKLKEVEGLMDLDTQAGKDYWDLMSLAGDYAYAGREWVARKVVEMLGGEEEDLIHNHHNFAWKEEHFGEELVVVRKGATPAFPGQRGFVGSSMGELSVVLRGTENPSEEVSVIQQQSLYSTVHGAGRVMGRNEAKGKWKKGRMVREGKVTKAMLKGWIDKAGVVLRGAGLDESPDAYKRLEEVLIHQHGTIEVLYVLKPMIVCMATGVR